MQIVRIAEVVVVLVQAIGDSAESAESLQPANDLGFNCVPRTLEFLLIGALAAEPLKLLVNDPLDFRCRVTRPCRDVQFEDRPQEKRLQLDGDVLGDLLFVHKSLVEPAGLAAGQNLGCEVGFCIAGPVDGRGNPAHVHTR